MAKKLNIRIITLGILPIDLDLGEISTYSSAIYELSGAIDNYDITSKADGDDWEYSDENLLGQIPENEGEDFLVVLTNVTLEQLWYTRRVKENVVVLTLNEISNYLHFNNIPLSNVVFRLLYAYSLVYRENKGRIPPTSEYTNFTHDDTRGCLFDMNGSNKYDIIHSCDKPIICDECKQRLVNGGVARNTIELIQNEIKKIKKDLFHQIADWITKHPRMSFVLGTLWVLILGLFTEYMGSIFFNGA